jgi:hypothetical protein
VWASAAEGVRLAKEIKIFTDEIKEMGPLNWPERYTVPTEVESAEEVAA